MKKEDKKGQAFLITAAILIMVITTIIAITNFSKKTSFSTFPYIAEEIQIESEKVMEYSLMHPNGNKIDDFTKDVSKYIDADTRIYFIDNNGIYNYSESENKQNPPLSGVSLNVNNNPITATIDSTEYKFPKLNDGEYFYFIMIREHKGEKYVYANSG